MATRGLLRMLVVAALLLLLFAPEEALARGGRIKLLEIQKRLRNLNKQGVKTIRSPDGDLIDCVPATQQPAFDHPKLSNHVLQQAPMAVMPVDTSAAQQQQSSDDGEGGKNPLLPQQWHQSGQCPAGTIPIRRTTIDDILRVGSLSGYGKKRHNAAAATLLRRHRRRPHSNSTSDSGDGRMEFPEPLDSTGHEHAIAYTTGEFYGAQASLNVWRPGVGVADEFSLSQIWLLGGSFANDLNSIEAGWQVSPELYGDHNPRLFTYWTSDSYQATGCYNLLCSGFIQTANDIAIGASIFPVSSLDGPQYDIKILVWKDPRTGNWWMRIGERALLGYWPAEIFSHLAGSASMIEWGGEVVNTQPGGDHTSTQMGSGHFPSQGFAESSYFRNLGVVDASNQLQTHLNLQTLAERPNCYSIQRSSNADWGDYFYYGGPGKNPSCR